LLEHKELKVQLVPKAYKVQRVLKVLLVLKVQKVLRELRVPKVPKEPKELKVRKEPLVLKARLVHKVPLVNLELTQQLLLEIQQTVEPLELHSSQLHTA
jgi:hypothetical protein